MLAERDVAATATAMTAADGRAAHGPAAMLDAVRRVRDPAHVVRDRDGSLGAVAGDAPPLAGGEVLVGTLPPLYPEWLGDRSFGDDHGVRFPYVAGEMANGISTTRMVTAMAGADMLGFFGAGGLGPDAVARAVDELTRALPGRANWAST